MMRDTVRIGTRGSALARWQTNYIADLLRAAWPNLHIEIQVISTKGDRVLDTPLPLVGGKGLFTAELEAALRGGEINLAVHSLKDLPTEQPTGLTVGAIPARANPADVLVSREGYTLDTLPEGATVGTSSRRRAAQLLHYHPDLEIADIRGNVDTRVRKALDPAGPYDAIILAHAGLARLERLDVVSQVLPLALMLPAPGQGALGVQCCDDAESLALLAPVHHAETAAVVTAERAFLAALGGGCAVPIAAYAQIEGRQLYLQGRVTALDGTLQVEVDVKDDVVAAAQIGFDLAQSALTQGAAAILEAVP